jgi:hypothetical protein
VIISQFDFKRLHFDIAEGETTFDMTFKAEYETAEKALLIGAEVAKNASNLVLARTCLEHALWLSPFSKHANAVASQLAAQLGLHNQSKIYQQRSSF